MDRDTYGNAASPPTIAVTAFVDWNAQMYHARARDAPPEKRAMRTLERTVRTVGRTLTEEAPAARFAVAFRLYHGWYRGWHRTENLRAIMAVVSQTDFTEFSHQRVVFSQGVEYGHSLSSALPERRHERPPIHLPNTLREQTRDEPPTEKMVDTALAADLLHWARNDPQGWALILSEDDDFVPPAFTAESWIKRHGGRVLIEKPTPKQGLPQAGRFAEGGHPMTTDTSLLADDLAIFADLGTEPPRLAVSGDRLTVRLFREGEQLELLFHDNGSGKIVERVMDSGETRTHASYRALLASERFGDLRRWADHQRRSIQEYLRDFIDPIPVKGQLFSSDISMDLSDFDDFLMAPHPRDQQSVRIMLVDGPAGIGKTKFIELLASSRASRFTTTQCPLVLHVQSRGRVLTFLQDLIAFSLQRLRVNVTFDQLPVLVRHGLVTLAIDGFDELGDPNGYELAWAQVNEMVDQVRGRGTLILAGRETFLGPDRIESSIKSLTEHDVIDALSLRPPTSETARQWLMKRNWSADDLLSAEALLEDDSYALRPFFLAEIANPEAISTIREKVMTNPLPFLGELMTEREASKFGDAIDRVMDWTQRRDYLQRLLREIARCMADDQTEAIDELMLTWLVELAAPDSADHEILALLKNRAAVMVFLENDAAPRHRRFTNSQVSNHFLSDVTIDTISRNEIPKYIRRNPLGADFLDAFSDLSLHLAASDRERVRRFFESASELVRTYSWIDQGVRNLGALLITMLPAMEGTDNLRLRNLDMDEALLQGTAPSAEIHKVFVNQLDVRGADLQDLTFDSAAITTLVVDETTRVPPSLPVPSQIQCEGFRGRSTAVITRPSSIESWLDSHGRSEPPAGQGDSGLVPDELRDHPLPRLLGRACRSKLYWIRLDSENGFPQFVADPRWSELLALLEDHGLARRERKSAAGRGTYFFHVRRSKDILSEDSQDAQIRAFYESLVKRIRAERTENQPGV